MSEKPKTFGELKKSPWGTAPMQERTVKDEMRANLIGKLEKGDLLFPGIVGYEDSVIPQIINAVLSRHNNSQKPHRTSRSGNSSCCGLRNQ